MTQHYVFDFTEKNMREPEKIILQCEKLCKRWGFQREIGANTGYDHYQGRISLRKKLRIGELCKEWPGAHWSITSNACSSGDAFYDYVQKEDTQVEGPWSDRDIKNYVPRQIREIQEWYPWQNFVMEKITEWDSRNINVIIDKDGCKGKSVLSGYLCVHGMARKIPPLNSYKDLMCMAMSMPTSRAYIIDMPRALDKSKQAEFYSAVESIKDGHLWDNRYTYKEKWIDSPNIWIFTNVNVNMDLLSVDRWRLWEITSEQELIRV